jgi:hypothetical protein
VGTNATGSNPPAGGVLLERLKQIDGPGSGLDADTVDGESAEDLGGGTPVWTPPPVDIGAVNRSGASQVTSAGAGWSLRFGRNGNHEIELQVALFHGGLVYDGAGVTPVLGFAFRDPAGPGDNVIWSLKHAWIRAGSDDPDAVLDGTNVDTIDVSGLAAGQLHIQPLTALPGKPGAVLLALTLGRQSSGPGSDTFNEHVYLHGLTLLRT